MNQIRMISNNIIPFRNEAYKYFWKFSCRSTIDRICKISQVKYQLFESETIYSYTLLNYIYKLYIVPVEVFKLFLKMSQHYYNYKLTILNMKRNIFYSEINGWFQINFDLNKICFKITLFQVEFILRKVCL